MICSIKKLITIGSGILFSVFFSVLSYSYSYAISDLSGTLTFDNTASPAITPVYACVGNCFDYQYLILQIIELKLDGVDYVPTYSNQWYYSFSFQNSRNQSRFNRSVPLSLPFIINDISTLTSDSTNIYQLAIGTGSSLPSSINGTFTGTIKWTLTNSYTTCPDPDPCPVVPENPYDNKLDNITKAIYVCAGTVLVIYFFYTIYRLIIKNSGVK